MTLIHAINTHTKLKFLELKEYLRMLNNDDKNYIEQQGFTSVEQGSPEEIIIEELLNTDEFCAFIQVVLTFIMLIS